MIPELERFAGLWRLERAIEDRRAGTAGAFSGSARLTPDGAGLRYEEQGTLTLPGAAPMQAARAYLWRREAEDIAVFFDDGRRFHVIGESARDRHWCDPDLYDVTYDFARWPDWSATWDVSGPRKDYRMVSRYSR